MSDCDRGAILHTGKAGTVKQFLFLARGEHLIPARWTRTRNEKLALIRIKLRESVLDQLASLPSDKLFKINLKVSHLLATSARNCHD